MSAPPTHLRWPADRFYWRAVAPEEVAGIARRRRHAAFGYLLEHVTPEPLEELHWTTAPTLDLGWIVCAAPRSALADLPKDTLSLRPATLPTHLSDEHGSFRAPNLLTGLFEPPRLRAQRMRFRAVVVALFATLAALTVTGLERRTASLHEQRAAFHRATAQVLAHVLDTQDSRADGPAAPPTDEPPERRYHLLLSEFRRLERLESTPRVATDSISAADLLEHLLAAWPADRPAEVESLAIDTDQARLVAILPDHESASAFEAHWREAARWSAETPTVTTARAGLRVTFTLIHTPDPHLDSPGIVRATLPNAEPMP